VQGREREEYRSGMRNFATVMQCCNCGEGFLIYSNNEALKAAKLGMCVQVVGENEQWHGEVAQPAQPPQPPNTTGHLLVGATAAPRSGIRQHTGFAGVRRQAALPSAQDVRSRSGQTRRPCTRRAIWPRHRVTAQVFPRIRPGQPVKHLTLH